MPTGVGMLTTSPNLEGHIRLHLDWEGTFATLVLEGNDVVVVVVRMEMQDIVVQINENVVPECAP